MGAGTRHFTPEFAGLTEVMETMGPGVNLEFLRRLKWATFGSTIHLVSNCEDVTDWDIETSGNFNAVNETSSKVTGSNAIELVDVGAVKGNFVTLDDGHCPNHEDWSEFNFLCMWVADDTALRLAGELTCQIKNGDTWSAELAIPVNSNVTVFEMKVIDISAIAKGDVTGFRFVNQRGSAGSEKVYVDEIQVTDIVAGMGSGASVAVGPVRGPIRPYLMQTGTILPGMGVNLEAGEADQGAENDDSVIGFACAYENADQVITATDDAPKEVLVADQGAVVICRMDSTGSTKGDKLGLDTNGLSLDEMTATCEQQCAIALDTGTANADVHCVVQKGGADN